jgi:AcrR family transcriptional regulator
VQTRDHHIVSAALSVFSRYGVSRTTMNDIAAEAGVSRQTLYNTFPGKTEILRAAVRLKMEEGLDAVRARWAETGELGARLDAFFEHGAVTWFDAVHASPELAQLLDGMNAIAFEEMAEGKARWVAFVEQEFRDAGLRPRDPEISIGEIADFLFMAAKSAKDASTTRPELLSRLKVIRQAVIAMTEGD